MNEPCFARIYVTYELYSEQFSYIPRELEESVQALLWKIPGVNEVIERRDAYAVAIDQNDFDKYGEEVYFAWFEEVTRAIEVMTQIYNAANARLPD